MKRASRHGLIALACAAASVSLSAQHIAIRRRDEVGAHRAVLDHLTAVERLVMGTESARSAYHNSQYACSTSSAVWLAASVCRCSAPSFAACAWCNAPSWPSLPAPRNKGWRALRYASAV